ncbi:site-2 protease family protein [Synechococcus elongatus]|uniref:Zinc metalloprotease n=1 Tax=Synechococcus elongatus PCC 11801 TaxID=2219813 RepID=A0AAN1QMR6_SYNEL|nr:site-2 protease family protein [Synechococcus elongatus]AZB72228.1 site-2 protease family protein [Synechococcus elongatus PCC 11801]
MQSGWRIGSILGIPLRIDPSWFVIVALVTFSYAETFRSQQPTWSPGLLWGSALAMAILLFVSVLAHELGHSLIAQAQGIRVSSITLFLFGGVAAIERESRTPAGAFWVAIAGPLVSLALALLLLISQLWWPVGSPAQVLSLNLGRLNFILAVFNLIPGLPLDGGQVLKAIAWKITGDRYRAVHWAANSGRLLSGAAMAIGLFSWLLLPGGFGGLWLALLGWFGWRNATAYDRTTTLQQALLSISAQSAMSRRYRVLEGSLTLRQFAELLIIEEQEGFAYFVASDGRYRGRISLTTLRQTERSRWDSLTLADLAEPFDCLPSVPETANLAQTIVVLQTARPSYVTVLTPSGAVAGIIDHADVIQALGKKLGFQLPPSELQQIRGQATYPEGLPLEMLAQSVLNN